MKLELFPEQRTVWKNEFYRYQEGILSCRSHGGKACGVKQVRYEAVGLGGAHSNMGNHWAVRTQNSGFLSLNVKFLHFLEETRFFKIEV